MDERSKSPTQLLVQDRTGRDLEDLLRDLYVTRRHSQQEIADALSSHGVRVSRSAVREWLGEFGITRDERPAVAL